MYWPSLAFCLSLSCPCPRKVGGPLTPRQSGETGRRYHFFPGTRPPRPLQSPHPRRARRPRAPFGLEESAVLPPARNSNVATLAPPLTEKPEQVHRAHGSARTAAAQGARSQVPGSQEASPRGSRPGPWVRLPPGLTGCRRDSLARRIAAPFGRKRSGGGRLRSRPK